MVCLALVANLLATGAPLLHAAAHEAHEARGGHDHHAEPAGLEEEASGAAGAAAGHDHDEIHPASLHEDCPLQLRVPALTGIPSVSQDLPPVFATGTDVSTLPPVLPCLSRAPPPGDPARAPPLA